MKKWPLGHRLMQWQDSHMPPEGSGYHVYSSFRLGFWLKPLNYCTLFLWKNIQALRPRVYEEHIETIGVHLIPGPSDVDLHSLLSSLVPGTNSCRC